MARNWQNCDFCLHSKRAYHNCSDRPPLVYKDYLPICIPGRHISSSWNAKQWCIKANNKVECELRWFWRHLYFGCHDKLPWLQLGFLPLAVCVQTRQSEKCPLFFILSVCSVPLLFCQHFWTNISIPNKVCTYAKTQGTFLGSWPGASHKRRKCDALSNTGFLFFFILFQLISSIFRQNWAVWSCLNQQLLTVCAGPLLYEMFYCLIIPVRLIVTEVVLNWGQEMWNK